MDAADLRNTRRIAGSVAGESSHPEWRGNHNGSPANWIAASVFALATAFAPMASRPALAVAAICVSFFAVTCLSVNYYAIPLDLFGSVSAGFAISLLTGVFGLMQAFLSPLIGGSSEKYGWQPVCFAIAALPLASAILLHWSFRKRWA